MSSDSLVSRLRRGDFQKKMTLFLLRSIRVSSIFLNMYIGGTDAIFFGMQCWLKTIILSIQVYCQCSLYQYLFHRSAQKKSFV